MKISWTNGNMFFGTMDIDMRYIRDASNISNYCDQRGALGCHILIEENHSQISLSNPFGNKMLFLETMSHEILHSFTDSHSHQTPLKPRNDIKDDSAVQIRTPEISSFYDRQLKKLGIAVLRSGIEIERI